MSSDTHVGPWIERDLRPYCPAEFRNDFDEYVRIDRAYRQAVFELIGGRTAFTEVEPGKWVRAGHNIETEGHYDAVARTRDMDFDGVAAEIIFHGSTNDEPIPFSALPDPTAPHFFVNKAPKDARLAAVGRHIYNEWLADFCSADPLRHIGLAQIPIWDVEAAVREVEWASRAGLKGINFPVPQSWLPEYNKDVWEPLWSVAEALGMPLVTHLAAAGEVDYSGADGAAINHFEYTVTFGKRMLPWLIYSGVFERHPNLRLVITEIPGCWWTQLLRDLDSVWDIRNPYLSKAERQNAPLKKICPHPPSDYCRQNVFVGASFMSRMEAETASGDGYYGNFMWGSDYPHIEGTFYFPNSWEETPMTRIALSHTFRDLPADHVRAMLGENAIRVFGLDHDRLRRIARKIHAPSAESINRDLPVPDDAVSLAFREQGIWN